MKTSLIDRRVYWITNKGKPQNGLVRAVEISDGTFWLLVEMDGGAFQTRAASEVSTVDLDTGAAS